MRLGVGLGRTFRIAKVVSSAVVNRYRPLLVDLVSMRRCGFTCPDCAEFGAIAKPVATSALVARIDRLRDLGVATLRLVGDHPLRHPEVGEIVRRGREAGMFVAVSSKGEDLTHEAVDGVQRAGIDHLHIDAETSSLEQLAGKLEWLSEKAGFTVTVQWALGGEGKSEDALKVARRAQELGFFTSASLDPQGPGPLRPLDSNNIIIYNELKGIAGPTFRLHRRFLDRLTSGLPNDWNCRAGARYLYVDEHGIVHYCAEQRGRPGIPLESYGPDDVRRAYGARKPCAPYCTVAVVQQIAAADSWRAPQKARVHLPRLPHAPRIEQGAREA